MIAYHLTDFRNVPGIKTEGLVPGALQTRRPFHLSVGWSWSMDARRGDDHAVFFITTLDHPMVRAFRARLPAFRIVVVEVRLDQLRMYRKTFRLNEVLIWGVIPPEYLRFTKLMKKPYEKDE